MPTSANSILSSTPGAANGNESPAVIKVDIQEIAEALSDVHSFFSGKTFLITGAFGFLGRYMVHLLRYLNDNVLEEKCKALLLDNFVTGYDATVDTDENLVFYRHNVIEPFETDQKIDYIIHAAGIASPIYYTQFPIMTLDVGTIGTRNMLELARKKSVKGFLFTSSSEVYGDPASEFVPTAEGYRGNVSIAGPRACYDESKRFGETMCYAFHQEFGVPVTIVRPFNVYGPGIRPKDYRVMPNFIEKGLDGEQLPVFGTGQHTRTFCYINDAIEALFRVLFQGKLGESYNIGNPSPEISILDLAKAVSAALPDPVDVVLMPATNSVYTASDPKRRCPDISKLVKATGFQPKCSLEDGIQRTMQWFEHLKEIASRDGENSSLH